MSKLAFARTHYAPFLSFFSTIYFGSSFICVLASFINRNCNETHKAGNVQCIKKKRNKKKERKKHYTFSFAWLNWVERARWIDKRHEMNMPPLSPPPPPLTIVLYEENVHTQTHRAYEFLRVFASLSPTDYSVKLPFTKENPAAWHNSLNMDLVMIPSKCHFFVKKKLKIALVFVYLYAFLRLKWASIRRYFPVDQSNEKRAMCFR